MTHAIRFVFDCPPNCSGGLSVPLEPECGCLERSLKNPSSSLLEVGDMVVMDKCQVIVWIVNKKKVLSAHDGVRRVD